MKIHLARWAAASAVILGALAAIAAVVALLMKAVEITSLPPD